MNKKISVLTRVLCTMIDVRYFSEENV